MKFSSYSFHLLSALFIVLAFTGAFEPAAFGFIKAVAEKNLGFLSLVSEVKLVLSGVSDVKIPFISGDAAEINTSLGKVQNYLLLIDGIALLQLMVLMVSKSWMVKGALLLLFSLCFFTRTRVLCSKLLILALAVNPGLSLFAVGVQQLTHAAAFDFGDSYASQLKASVLALKSEKAALIQEHEQKLTEIDNGQSGNRFFRRLKEDVAYDFKKAKVDITGEYSHLRALIHEAGQEMLRKIFAFCTMVLFCFLLLPIGYVLIIFILYKRLGFSSPAIAANELIKELAPAESGKPR